MLHNATLNLYQVYPRACGGTTIFMGNTETVGSLSPRVRGNLPARCLSRNNQMVYPRACGGTMFEMCFHCLFPGLSPRVRGNRQYGGTNGLTIGSIPARAGEPLPT